MHERKLPEDLRIHSAETLLSAAKEAVTNGRKLLVINDYDDTLADSKQQSGDDPRKCPLFPTTAKALETLQEEGHLIGIISNRSGGQIAKRLTAAAIDQATIISSYGYEEFFADSTLPELGISRIDSRFSLHRTMITGILTALRSQITGGEKDFGTEVEIEIATPGGPLILERKGITVGQNDTGFDSFPEGIAHVYNFNQVTPEARVPLIQQLQLVYDREMGSLLDSSPEKAMYASHLKTLWGMLGSEQNTPDRQGRYSLAFEPINKANKAYGMGKLLGALHEQGKLQDAGLIIYAGDTNQDAAAMQRLNQLKQFGWNKEHTEPLVAGIWVNPGREQEDVHSLAKLSVHGVEAYGDLLTRLAALTQK